MARTTIRTEDITDSEVTTAKILDDNVTTAKVLDNNVTLPKLDDGTQGDILYYGGSGAPTRLGFGTDGYFLKTQGTGANPIWAEVSGGTSWQAVQTSGFTAVAGNGYPCNTSGGEFTVTLPASASAGDTIELIDYAGNFASNPVTLDPQSLNLNGATTDLGLTYTREGLRIVYVDATQGWVAASAANDSRPAIGGFLATGGTETTYNDGGVDYKVHTFNSSSSLVVSSGSVEAHWLVIAGGGGGGGYGAAGGAGGYRSSLTASGGGGPAESTETLTAATYTVTVGGGGAGGANGPSYNSGVIGSNSVFNAGQPAAITSIGGGYGGSYASPAGVAGGVGGSGGGGGISENATGASGGAGTANQGYAGSDGSDRGGGGAYPGAGAGGGAGAVAGNYAGTTGGAGGVGLESNINGSDTFRAGGGSGAGAAAGVAGNGGGGTGGTGHNITGTAGTANTGGGAGGGGSADPSAAGGSGVVIIRYEI